MTQFLLFAAPHLSNHIDVTRINWPATVLVIVALLAAAAITCIGASLYIHRRRK